MLALCYAAPLINFLFNNNTIFILPVHQRLNYPDPGGSFGRRALLIAISFTALFYGVIYTLANISCDGDDYNDTVGIPLLFNYLLNGTGYASFPILVILSIVAILQLPYDLWMAAEQIMTIYRELKLKAFSTRIDRLNKLQFLGPKLDFLESGESKAIFSLALEETSRNTKVLVLVVLVLINVACASFLRFFWFYIVVFGSFTTPFLTYIVPGFLYYTEKKKESVKIARIAFGFAVFGLVQILLIEASSIFMWHVDLYY